MTLLIFAILACGAQKPRNGLVFDEQGKTLLVEQSGKRWNLNLEGEAVALEHALGCSVVISGRATGRSVKVRDWKITDSGFGSEPHVGYLKRHGGNWIMDDRNTGSLIQFEVESMGRLTEADGALVLVDGVVVGPQLIRVASFRILQKQAETGGAE
jgi:hypothetical protein